MTNHKLVKKLTEKAKNEKLLSSGKRPVMELQINRAIRKERVQPINSGANIPGANYNF